MQLVRRLAKRPLVLAMATIIGLSLLLFACAGLDVGANSDWSVPSTYLEDEDLGSLAYRQSGVSTGQVVVFVHGTPGSASAWKEYIEDVPDDMKFIAIDRPGFGLSGEAVVPELQRQVAAIEPHLPEQGKAILVGHSLGGPIIAQAAVDFPDRVGALVIVAGSLDPRLEKINPLQYLGRVWPISSLLPTSLYNSNLELFALKKELQLLEERLSEIDMPVVLIHGTSDRLVPYSNVAFVRQKMTKARLEVVSIEDGNHFLPWNARETIDLAIVQLTKGLGKQSRTMPITD